MIMRRRMRKKDMQRQKVGVGVGERGKRHVLLDIRERITSFNCNLSKHGIQIILIKKMILSQ